jgi:hypothetical protein
MTDGPKQRTPTGYEMPIPKRGDFLLDKAAQPLKRLPSRRRPRK